ncbi:MAG: hypothetical protein LBU42_10370 [Prevotellaceae bacterium]|jgi:PBP1b-binding outer membrane lipoprotein LpoB|nr:hypothetical protein [Prevotellaceae bacterium]
MKKESLLIAAVAGMFLVSCVGNNATKKQDSEKTDKTTSLIDSLAQSAIIDSTGSILEMAFDDENNTALLVLNGEIIELKGDTVASGIKYSNLQYEFREWQGEITLKKDSVVVFSYKKQ